MEAVCQGCGFIARTKPPERCPECGDFRGFVTVEPEPLELAEHPDRVALDDVKSIAGLGSARLPLLTTGVSAFDHALGGGVVEGGAYLVGGSAGLGKTTLWFHAAHLIAEHSPALYVSGEQPEVQLKMLADRLRIRESKLLILAHQRLEKIEAAVSRVKPKLLVVDSIQSIASDDDPRLPGEPSQVKLCAARLLVQRKLYNMAVVLIGHMTKDETLAGPTSLSHLVDVVLYLDGDPAESARRLTAAKNRFGSTAAASAAGVFTMGAHGLLCERGRFGQ